MELTKQILIKRRDFNTTLALTGIIPFLVFVYLLAGKSATLNVFVGEIGYIVFITLIVFILGIIVGRKMLMGVIQEVIDKNRLLAVTETTLALSHEINNPLLAMRGNLELLESEFPDNAASEGIRNRLFIIKNHCERIREVTEKLSNLTKPVVTTIHGDTKMIDLSVSR